VVSAVRRKALLDQLAAKVVDRLLHRKRRGRRRGYARLGAVELEPRELLRAEMLRRELDDEPASVTVAQRPNADAGQRVLELADVAGPRIPLQPAPRGGTEPRVAHTEPAPGAFEEVSGEEHHVSAALPERGDAERVDAQAVIEIDPKAAGQHLLFQVAIR